jgi:hypothetical protein
VWPRSVLQVLLLVTGILMVAFRVVVMATGAATATATAGANHPAMTTMTATMMKATGTRMVVVMGTHTAQGPMGTVTVERPVEATVTDRRPVPIRKDNSLCSWLCAPGVGASCGVDDWLPLSCFLDCVIVCLCEL